MKHNVEYKNQALNALEGNWVDAGVMFVVYYFIASILTSAGTVPFKSLGEGWEALAAIVLAILVYPMSYAIVTAYRLLLNGGKCKVPYLFRFYSEKRVWTTMILKSVYTILWTLLLIIPGIIRSYSYAMTEYIMMDDQEISDNKAIEKSMAMMDGKKWKLFCLDISFIGWIILSLLTFGLGFILLCPYIYTARAAFYEDLKAELQPAQAEEPVAEITE